MYIIYILDGLPLTEYLQRSFWKVYVIPVLLMRKNEGKRVRCSPSYLSVNGSMEIMDSVLHSCEAFELPVLDCTMLHTLYLVLLFYTCVCLIYIIIVILYSIIVYFCGWGKEYSQRKINHCGVFQVPPWEIDIGCWVVQVLLIDISFVSSRYMEYIGERGSIAQEHELSGTVMWLSWQSIFLTCPEPLESVPSTE